MCWGQRFRQIDLRRSFHALARNIEKRDGPHRRFPGAKTFRIRFPAKAQSSDDARARDDDARLSGLCNKRKQHDALLIF